MTSRATQPATETTSRDRRFSRWAEAIVLGLVTNVVWTVILAALHSWHVRWLPAHEGIWPDVVSFFTLGNPRLFGLWVGGFAAAMLAITTLTGPFPEYLKDRQRRTSDWHYDRKRADRAGREFALGFGILLVSGIALFCVGESLLFIAGTIYNMTAAHPVLTPFAGAWGN